jgi:hypothetical protein
MKIVQVKWSNSRQKVAGIGNVESVKIGQRCLADHGVGTVSSVEIDTALQCIMIRKVDAAGKPAKFVPRGSVGSLDQSFDVSCVPIGNVECFGIVDDPAPSQQQTREPARK